MHFFYQELIEMNDILMITLDAIIDHGTHAKTCAATCT